MKTVPQAYSGSSERFFVAAGSGIAGSSN